MTRDEMLAYVSEERTDGTITDGFSVIGMHRNAGVPLTGDDAFGAIPIVEVVADPDDAEIDLITDPSEERAALTVGELERALRDLGPDCGDHELLVRDDFAQVAGGLWEWRDAPIVATVVYQDIHSLGLMPIFDGYEQLFE